MCSITVVYNCRSQFSAVYKYSYILNNTHCFWLFPPGLYYCENNFETCLAHFQHFFLLAALLYAKKCIIAFFSSKTRLYFPSSSLQKTEKLRVHSFLLNKPDFITEAQGAVNTESPHFSPFLHCLPVTDFHP
jgi:hypothetical protein